MTAGGGILHIEAPPEHLVVSGGLFHGFQLWVNLPRADKLKPPAYQDLRSSEVKPAETPPMAASPGVIAGEVGGLSGRDPRTPPWRWCTIAPGYSTCLACRLQRTVYVMSGDGFVGPSQAHRHGPARAARPW